MGYPRLDEEVEASGWNSKHQTQLDEYFASVADIPEEDWNGDEDEEDEDDGDEDVDEDPGNAENGAGEGSAGEDEVERANRMAARLEQIRLNRALGNDEPDSVELQDHDNLDDSGPDDASEPEGTSEDENDEGQNPAAAIPGTQDKVRRRAPGRGKISDRLEKEFKTPRGSSGKDGRVDAGKAKGHKWKTSEKYLVGKNSGW